MGAPLAFFHLLTSFRGVMSLSRSFKYLGLGRCWGRCHQPSTYAQNSPKLDLPPLLYAILRIWLDLPLCVRTFYISPLINFYSDSNIKNIKKMSMVSIYSLRPVYTFLYNNKWQCNTFFCTKKETFLDFVVQKIFLRTYATLKPTSTLYVIVRIWFDSSPPYYISSLHSSDKSFVSLYITFTFGTFLFIRLKLLKRL